MRRSGTAATVLAALMSLVLAGQALGVTWSPSIKVSDEPTGYLMSARALATASGVTHLTYVADGIRYRRSTNLGGSWGTERMLAADTDTVQAGTAAIAAYGDLVVVVYRTRNSTTGAQGLYLHRSLDRGLSWLPRQLLAGYTSDRRMGTPSVAVGSSGIHVVWTDRRDGKVYYRRSTDGGAEFQARVALAVTTRRIIPTIRDGWPSVATSGTRVYVVWSPADAWDGECGDGLVMRRSLDGGATFKATQVLDARAQFDLPALSASGAALLVTFTTCDWSVEVARSADSGATFTRRTIATVDAFHGDVNLAGASAQVVYDADSTTARRILLRTSTDGGTTWSAAMTVASVSLASGDDPTVPNVASVTTTVLVGWQRVRSESGESIGVFTRRGTLP